MLEFQSSTDPYMAVRILVYTGLLYQDLIRRGALGADGRLPPVLPVVLYNGRPRWAAPVEAADLIAPVEEALARFVSSHRSGIFCLTRDAHGEDDLPRCNLVSALIAFENSRSAAELPKLLAALSDWVRGPGEDELRRAFVEWIRQVLPRGAVRRGRAAEGAGSGRGRGDAGGASEGVDRAVAAGRPRAGT